MGKRVFLIVLDSFGIGYEPDADVYGDVGSNTLNTIAKSDYFRVPQMQKLGLFNIDQVECGAKIGLPLGAYGRLREKIPLQGTGKFPESSLINHFQYIQQDSPKKFYQN